MAEFDTCPKCSNSMDYEVYDFDGERCMVRFMCPNCNYTREQEYKMQAVKVD